MKVVAEISDSGDSIYESSNSVIYHRKKEGTQKDRIPEIIKVLQNRRPSPRQIIELNNEYEVTKTLELPGVRRALGQIKFDGRHALLLEYFEGIPVFKYFKNKNVKLEEFLRWGITIAAALHSLHKQHIIHRDICGDNILINPDTGEVKLIDLGISSRFDLRIEHPGDPESLEGTLNYISPEQTGGVNRMVDYRSDLYSLGATFYELLAAYPPFEFDDPTALMRAHISREARPLYKIPAEERPGRFAINRSLSDVVAKLMEKNAEDRYQSADGLKADLEFLLEHHLAGHEPDTFSPGSKDYSTHFILSRKLYGRDQELEKLKKTFEAVGEGAVRLTLVTGASGVGKSALIHEIYKEITEKQGYFISGKFDRSQRYRPFYALSLALNEFCRRLPAESAEKLADWRTHINSALGNNGQVALEIFPDLEAVLGAQASVPEPGPVESKNRFALVIRNFIMALSYNKRPLVIFFDDLQWADQASLDLIKSLVSDRENRYLLILGAYRDNEVDDAHPLADAIAALKKNGTTPQIIPLYNLSLPDLGALLGDSLSCEPNYTLPLCELVYKKTQGNIFFTRVFIKSLYEEGLLSFSHEQKNWRWELEKINNSDCSDNVLEMIAGKIEKLPEQTRQLLQLAACIGDQFELSTPATIYERTPSTVIGDLREAITEGLLLPLDQNYKIAEFASRAHLEFSHNRVRQAAYSLIPVDKRKSLHLKIGRTLRKETSADKLPNRVFSIVNHLNNGRSLIQAQNERKDLAELNLLAGQKARRSTAYDSARNYLEIGRELLGTDRQDSYDTRLSMLIEQSKVEFQTGAFENSHKLLDQALEHTHKDLDRARIFLVKLVQFAGQDRRLEAVSTSITALNMFGLKIPSLDQKEKLPSALATELELYNRNMQNRNIADLENLPLMDKRSMILCTEIIATVLDSVLSGVPEYSALYTAKMFNLSIEHGLSEFVPAGYAFFAMVLSMVYKDYQSSCELVELAYQLNREKFPRPDIHNKINTMGYTCSLLQKHFKTGVEMSRAGFALALEVGDFHRAGYSCYWGVYVSIALNIEESLKIATPCVTFLKKANKLPMLLLTQLWVGVGRCLQGTGAGKNTGDLDYEDFSEALYLKYLQDDPDLFAGYQSAKLQVLALSGRYEDAWPLLENWEKWSAPNLRLVTPFTHEVALFVGVTAAALYTRASEENKHTERKQFLKKALTESLEILKDLTERTKINYEHACLILQAEKARIEKRPIEAIPLYERAVQSAIQYEFPRSEYLANELTGRFYLERGLERVAAGFLNYAVLSARRWGASALAKRLEKKYSTLLRQSAYQKHSSLSLDAVASTTISSGSETGSVSSTGLLDISSVIKASRAISGEIDLEKLLTRMISIIIENAGARRGFLILHNDKGSRVEVSKDLDADKEIEVLQSIPLEQSQGFSRAIVYYVIRSGETRIYHDAREETRREGIFADDPYIKKTRPRSILCMPLRHKDKIGGALYLENNLTAAAFTEERIELLNILLSQASVSLENAKVYEHLEELVKERTRKLEKTHQQLLETAHRAGMAEVAVSVLNKVENAINNASHPAALIKAGLDQSRLADLVEAFILLKQHQTDSTQLTDEFPRYVRTLYEGLQTERKEISRQLNNLFNDLENIKEIIHLQQSYAGGQRLEEEISLPDLLEDAIRIESASPEESDIKIRRNFNSLPTIRSGRHRLLLILINLLSNARESLQACDKNEKEIRLYLDTSRTRAGVTIQIRVEDNGQGIRPEILDKIFSSGYSGRDGGRGYGLHNAANAATELGGTLTAYSEGPKRGAQFTLTLPDRHQQHGQKK